MYEEKRSIRKCSGAKLGAQSDKRFKEKRDPHLAKLPTCKKGIKENLRKLSKTNAGANGANFQCHQAVELGSLGHMVVA